MEREPIDLDWVSLIKEAKQLGLSIEEIKTFLSNSEVYTSKQQPDTKLSKII
ncbi:anti-repressor SinI family protein [Alkalihalobacillus sp. 1P02AB]|uniref:anti-repressor SinI family protein n=1 Tax=Alkalihalobacillus sp. 1P02AB TaxID=3132260 RepID=UPI0039A755C7